jgi:hypothetical protein
MSASPKFDAVKAMRIANAERAEKLAASRNTDASRNTVTKYPLLVTAQSKRGRRPIGDQAMTPAERQRRARHRKAARALKQAEGAAS